MPPQHFLNLGLPSNIDSIHIAGAMPLAAAPFWTSSQAAFIREALSANSDWAEIVDQLKACLRA
jgi:hypothetical protein